ncbi:ABC transporter substrate-binding protein [Acidocella facilis]|uniref:ABC transporter substrate-binding protein n=1 Tax=Acidocella facilis TaxID=525 RepID=UPI001F191C8E|nr:ABC transporter substrate-binding protein [Acidocella facilis]
MAMFDKLTGMALGLMLASSCLVPVSARADGLPASITSSKTVTFCSSLSQPPMEFVNAQQQPQGADIELGDALAKRLGLTAKWVNTPFSGLIPALQAGACDAIISQLFIKPARLQVVDMVPYMYSQEIILFKKGMATVDTLAGLSGKKVASVTGTTATVLLQAENDKLKAAGKPLINIVDFPSNTDALQQLQFGQVAAYGVSYEIGRYYNQTAPGEFVTGGAPYFKILTGIATRKNEPGLRDAFAAQLADMMKDGSYAAIFKKWDLASDVLDAPMQPQP